MAVQELFPGTQVTIGPVIENGFYYDFARKEPFTSDDLKKIENKMSEIIDKDVKTRREIWERDKAISHFKKIGEFYKAEIIESIPKDEDVSIYFHGDWHDLCRGPHLSSTGKIGKYFVTGNHEYYSGVDQWLDKTDQLGLTNLIDSHEVITKGSGTISLGGVTDFRSSSIKPEHKSDAIKAFSGAPNDKPKILLAHQPWSIFNAHKAAAEIAETSHFYVIDADAIMDEEFTFKFKPQADRFVYETVPETDCVFVWRSRNPINDLLYGYGGAKLFPRKKLLEAENWNVDMTTTIGCIFVPKFQVSNITGFNTSEFETWKSAFRECVKLSSKVIDRQDNKETEARLNVWCNNSNDSIAIAGAKAGRQYGEANKNNKEALAKINDFDWLKEQYNDNPI